MKYISLQAAIDFLSAYGIALIIISIALAVILKVAYLNPTLSTSSCTPAPGFACEFYAINTSGILTISIAQATGSEISINGFACASLPNATGTKPMFGNIYVTNSLAYYPANSAPTNSIPLYSGEAITLHVYCYNAGGIAKSMLGNSFIGYLWLNYTVPSYGKLVQQVAILNLRYT